MQRMVSCLRCHLESTYGSKYNFVILPFTKYSLIPNQRSHCYREPIRLRRGLGEFSMFSKILSFLTVAYAFWTKHISKWKICMLVANLRKRRYWGIANIRSQNNFIGLFRPGWQTEESSVLLCLNFQFVSLIATPQNIHSSTSHNGFHSFWFQPRIPMKMA